MIHSILILISIILQSGCVYIAYKAYTNTRSNTAYWWFIWTAFMLMTLRRVTTLIQHVANDFNFPAPNVSLIDNLHLPMVITILLFIGMLNIYKYNKIQDKKFEEDREELRKLTEKLSSSPYNKKRRCSGGTSFR